MMGDNSDVVTHRCAERKQGYGIRCLNNSRYKGWYLMYHEFDWWEWNIHSYLPVVKINYCPFCGARMIDNG